MGADSASRGTVRFLEGRETSGGATMRVGSAWFFGLLLSTGAMPALASLQSVSFPGSDGVSVSATYYRPSVPSSSGVVFFPGRKDGLAPWLNLADSLAAHGWHVLVAPISTEDGAGAAEVSRRTRAGLTPEGEAWRDALAALEALRHAVGDSIRNLVWGGAEEGAAAAVLAASRADRPPAALILLSPRGESSAVPIAPVLAGMERPFLLVTSRNDDLSAAVARTIFLTVPTLCDFWECEGALRGDRLLLERPFMVTDIVGWLDREEEGG